MSDAYTDNKWVADWPAPSGGWTDPESFDSLNGRQYELWGNINDYRGLNVNLFWEGGSRGAKIRSSDGSEILATNIRFSHHSPFDQKLLNRLQDEEEEDDLDPFYVVEIELMRPGRVNKTTSKVLSLPGITVDKAIVIRKMGTHPSNRNTIQFQCIGTDHSGEASQNGENDEAGDHEDSMRIVSGFQLGKPINTVFAERGGEFALRGEEGLHLVNVVKESYMMDSRLSVVVVEHFVPDDRPDSEIKEWAEEQLKQNSGPPWGNWIVAEWDAGTVDCSAKRFRVQC